MKILFVYPETPETLWGFKHVLRFISKRDAFPPLELLSVTAMLPSDWELRLVDTNVAPLQDQDLRWADYVMISAMIVHKESVNEIVGRCHKLAKPIIAGGPLFTTGHAAFPQIQYFVLGEAEEIMPQLIEDIKAGRAPSAVPNHPFSFWNDLQGRRISAEAATAHLVPDFGNETGKALEMDPYGSGGLR